MTEKRIYVHQSANGTWRAVSGDARTLPVSLPSDTLPLAAIEAVREIYPSAKVTWTIPGTA